MRTSIFTRARLGAAIAAVALTAPAISAQDWTERLSVHGSLNAAYGKSDGLGVYGVDKSGTSDYRAIALQFGYKLDNHDRVVVQLLHRALGTSPLQAVEPTLYPIWAFYERKAGPYTIKLGRNPLPRGIDNEIRFIGTLLPFYRAAPALYGETLENIDGAVVSRTFDLDGGWALEAHAMGGGFDVKGISPGEDGESVVLHYRAKNAYGTQLWLDTPVQGLRVGASGVSYEYDETPLLPDRPPRTLGSVFSIDGAFAHWSAKSEYLRFDAPDNGGGKIAFQSYYAQGTYRLTDALSVSAEYDHATNFTSLPAPFPAVKIPVFTDIGGGVSYAPSSNVRFKLEAHRQEGYSFDTPVPTLIPPTAPPLVMRLAPKSRANYAIASVAVSF